MFVKNRIGWSLALGSAMALTSIVLFSACTETPTQPSAVGDNVLALSKKALGKQTATDDYVFETTFDGWQGTGFIVRDGLPVQVSATGVGSCGSQPCEGGPDGVNAPWLLNGVAPPGFLVEGGQTFALFARVGDGLPILVGSGPTEVAGSGELTFGYNDFAGTYDNNSGEFLITVSYPCKPGHGFGDTNHYHCGPPGK